MKTGTARLAVVAMLASLLLLPAGAAQSQTSGLSACDHQPYYGDIPCGEVDRAIHESAVESGVDETRMREIVLCESTFDPFASNSPYEGLFQQDEGSWGQRVAEFNAAVDPDAPGDIHSPFDNARVSARMLAQGMESAWPNC
jgi:hypothetical protein